MKKGSSRRSIEDINRIQELEFKAELYLTQALGINVNTKLHRMMHHMRDSLMSFGRAGRGDTDLSETLHKTTKRCYK